MATFNAKRAGWDKVDAFIPGESSLNIPDGGYICNIVKAEFTKSAAGNDMLKIYFDIAEGEFAGRLRDAFNRKRKTDPNAKWDYRGTYYQVCFDYTGKLAGTFKGLISVLKKCNPSYNPDIEQIDDAQLKGLFVGMIFCSEEYEDRNGNIRTKTVPRKFTTTEKIRSGDFTIPPLKELDDKPAAAPQRETKFMEPLTGGTPIDDADVPF